MAKEVRVYPITDPNLVDVGATPSEVHVDPNNQTVESTIQETPVIISVPNTTIYTVGVQGPTGATGTTEEEVAYAKRIDFESDSTIVYKGEAQPGAVDSAAVWRIHRLVLNSEFDVVQTWADGDANFDNIWDDRLSLSYS